jgi:hypothetical protein
MPATVARPRSRALRLLLVLVMFVRPIAGLADDADEPLLRLPSPVGDLTYTPGRGAHLGGTGVTLGGYANVDVTRDEGGPGLLSVDDLSLFVGWAPTPRLHLLSELEIEDALEVDDHGRGGIDEAHFTAERLYADAIVSDALVLRIGKFLTPVGRWNVIHAQPLVWTTSRPLATTMPFDPHTTGAMLWGTLPAGRGTVGYTLYGQATDQLDPSSEPTTQDRAGGARFEYGTGSGWSVGASYLAFTENERWHQLGGLDGFWRRRRFELLGEFIYEEVERGAGHQWGLYVQPVVELLPKIYLVLRYEHYDQPSGPTVDLGVGGLAWRPFPYLVLKAEYLTSHERAAESPPGFKSSVALLF